LTAQRIFGSLTQWDDTVLQWLHSRNTPLGIRIMDTWTILGTGVFTAILGIGIAVLLSHKRQWAMFKGWTAAFVGGPMIENILKWSIRRPRPEFAGPFLHHFSYSFPSGHALNSTAVYGMLTYIVLRIWTPRRAAKIGIVVFSILLVMGIGFSRLYLGVHYLSDVLGGFSVGIVWLATCIVFTERSLKAGRLKDDIAND